MNTTKIKTIAVRLIETHAYAKRRKGGLNEWMTVASELIYKATGKHFHGNARCDGFILHALREIAA